MHMDRGQSDAEIAAELARRQEQLRLKAAALEKAGPGAPGRDEAITALMFEGDDFVEYQEKIPTLRAQWQRQRELRIVGWCAGGVALDLAALSVTVFAGAVSWNWMVLIVPLLLLVAGAFAFAGDVPETRQLNLWPGVLALITSGVLADLLFAHVLGWVWSLLALGAAVGGFLKPVP
jgi:hypothetical protein